VTGQAGGSRSRTGTSRTFSWWKQPGYRPLQRELHGTGTFTTTTTIQLCMRHVAGSPVHLVTNTYTIDAGTHL
jgi:hypothetical protein